MEVMQVFLWGVYKHKQRDMGLDSVFEQHIITLVYLCVCVNALSNIGLLLLMHEVADGR